ncbi:MAG: serine/threonine protein kinase, partial [Planctomycetota bacterium]
MDENVPSEPDSTPTIHSKDKKKVPDEVRTVKTRKVRVKKTADRDETPTIQSKKMRPTAPAGEAVPKTRIGSITARLQSQKGIRGDVSLPVEDEGGEIIAGPASEDRYSVLGEVARGGMGAIVKIVDNDIRRPMAMKVILGEKQRDQLERFVEEAQVTGQLEHPNIVPVHELGLDEEGAVYFTMKLVKGESLESIVEKLARKDPAYTETFPLTRLLEIFLKVCDAMAFAHAKGVIHRDLKPENVMVGKFGEVLVMDWGLAKVKGREDTARDELVASIRSEKEVGQTLDGDVMGTPSYMPPEQANGDVEEIGERSDVFALGGILYKILTHIAPYTASSMTAIIAKAVKGTVIPPRSRNPGARIPRELEAICLKAMAFKGRERYGSVEALAGDVRSYLAHRLVKAHRYGLFSKAVRFMQRHPAGSLAGGVALVLLAVGAAVTGVVAGEARAARARAREEQARAESESFKRKEAEREKAEAVEARDTAVDMLEKGRRVSAVLRSANLELGQVLKDLKKSFYSEKTEKEKREIGDAHWPAVEAFFKGIAEDSASQAAGLAVKGWLKRLSGYEEEGFETLKASVQKDPDVAYGRLFEGMAWLSKYLAKQPMPSVHINPTGVDFGPPPPETEVMMEARQKFEAILEDVEGSGVWGESSSGDFREVLQGFKAMQSGDLDAADRGLTKALSVPEMTWLTEEILLARAKVRYLNKAFGEGIGDIEKVLMVCPASPDAYFVKALLWDGDATMKIATGINSQRASQEAITAYEETLRSGPDFDNVYLNL